MKKMKMAIAISGTIFFVFFGLMTQLNYYYSRDYFNGLLAVWNKHDLWIFIQKDTNVERVPAWKFALTKMIGSAQPVEAHTRSEVLIFQVNDGAMTNYVQPEFKVAGQLLVLDDTIYLIHGGYTVTGFRWDRDRFIKVDENRLTELRKLLKPGAKLLPDGWDKLDWQDFGTVGDNYDKSFEISGFSEPGILHLKQGTTRLTRNGYLESNPPIQIDLTLSKHQKELLRLSQNFHRITSTEFKTFRVK